MKVIKFKKKNKDEYEIFLDNNTKLTVYDEVIIKNNLLLKRELDDKTLKKIIQENKKESIYVTALKYISIRIRSEKEINDYLQKKGFDTFDINNTIKKLKLNKLINDEEFVKSYINDKLLMTNYGPYKIKNELLKHRINEELIEKYINNINQDQLVEKLNKIINKYVKTNKKYTEYMLKNKLTDYLNTLGYPNYLYNELLSSIKVDNDEELLKKEVEKQYNKLSKKYNGKELELKIIAKLYQKGFNRNSIDNILQQYYN